MLAPLGLRRRVEVVAVLEVVLLVDLVQVGDVQPAVQLLGCFRTVVAPEAGLAVAEDLVWVEMNPTLWF